jgi:hypothetical protein
VLGGQQLLTPAGGFGDREAHGPPEVVEQSVSSSRNSGAYPAPDVAFSGPSSWPSLIRPKQPEIEQFLSDFCCKMCPGAGARLC